MNAGRGWKKCTTEFTSAPRGCRLEGACPRVSSAQRREAAKYRKEKVLPRSSTKSRTGTLARLKRKTLKDGQECLSYFKSENHSYHFATLRASASLRCR
jgi:hypothetical protein